MSSFFINQLSKILFCIVRVIKETNRMMFMRLSLAIVCVVSLAIFRVSLAQNSPQDYLNAHKAARAIVGVGPMRWDAKVASYARNYVNKLKGSCKLVHSGGPYGENLAWGSTDLSGTAAVNMWVAEKPKYDYNSNSCVGGECRHYTQVVWRNSVRLGCAKVRCNNGGTIISCNYDPPGNYVNQRPYLRVLQQPLDVFDV
ncbi:hypothetical protein F2P56_028889 [Juglans regia]|uniref:Pathogenesis-related protein 1-like n=2 Tax=Juglans regia TaxID=51240 RepID=A0A2I4HRD3_JUGRE|nr:pathogenesis-related protein 1-like [Juglans regia]KAF5448344.1 hypothetical protein F2P56_028889 [Juglans regia]